MRRVLLAVMCAASVLALPGPALAGTVKGAAKGAAVCTIGDTRLDEISGMVATVSGYAVVDDSSDLDSHLKIFFLDGKCKVSRTVSYPTRPRDTEDMALAPDGTIWVADIGDNDKSRQTVALWRLAKGARSPVIYRLSYPDGQHDAEALVLAGDGTPVIVTKDPITARLYVPATPLRAKTTVPMKRVGEFSLTATGTSNPFSIAGRLVVTGGANSPDGSRVVLRTYADAFEFDVTGGDVVKAITTGTPRITALPDEPQGESIAYSPGDASFLTVSETADQPAGTKPTILRYTPTGAPGKTKSAPASAPGSGSPASQARSAKADQTRIPYLSGLVGLVLVLLGGAAWLRARRRNI
jgi:hypothetical protein